MTTSYESSLYQFKTKKSFLSNLGIVQINNQSESIRPQKAEVAKVNDYLLEKSTDGKGVSLPMSSM
jgi:hypothetical protein